MAVRSNTCRAARANRSIFFKRDGSARSFNEIRNSEIAFSAGNGITDWAGFAELAEALGATRGGRTGARSPASPAPPLRSSQTANANAAIAGKKAGETVGADGKPAAKPAEKDAKPGASDEPVKDAAWWHKRISTVRDELRRNEIIYFIGNR